MFAVEWYGPEGLGGMAWHRIARLFHTWEQANVNAWPIAYMGYHTRIVKV